MTQKEFEERTGLKLSADGYTEVEECYMNTDLDKDAFCKLWMENPTALKEIERKTVLVRELYEERKCLTNLLIDQAEKWSASDLREKAIAMIGENQRGRNLRKCLGWSKESFSDHLGRNKETRFQST